MNVSGCVCVTLSVCLFLFVSLCVGLLLCFTDYRVCVLLRCGCLLVCLTECCVFLFFCVSVCDWVAVCVRMCVWVCVCVWVLGFGRLHDPHWVCTLVQTYSTVAKNNNKEKDCMKIHYSKKNEFIPNEKHWLKAPPPDLLHNREELELNIKKKARNLPYF